ncbi:MAG: phosphate ABC transporter substrate-binding protein PstS [Dehalococcoidia bacterium]|nr:phosphate ABC transporter substrate-binding protein PstS [Dehalococcoidia bacterium]MDD5493351.1 phosphate ABC transporter substrate-binding protein PstS [Dehalococcoidia bacterium]
MSKLVRSLTIPFSVLLIAAVGFSACGGPSGGTSSSTTVKSASLTGAGATFPAPLYTKWFDEYHKLTGVKVNYQPIGSGGGISQIIEGTVDFGASDGIMTAEQQSKAESRRGPILHIPMTSGAVAVVYNLAGIGSGQLKLSGDILADIYLKKITKWNDPAVASLNPGIALPDAPIAVVHRSDGSGTTYIFTNYLSKISPEWGSRVGNATSVNWPGDIGGQGNAGVAGQVQQIPNSIGYVELAYAEQNKMSWATLKNKAGNFIEPTLEATTRAAEGVILPDDMKVMLTDSGNAEAYPVVGFTWMLVYVNQADKSKGETLAKVLWWAIHEGQEYTGALGYARLADSVVTRAENQLLSIKYQEQPLLSR